MTNDNEAFPPPPVKDDKVHITVTEGQKTILGTGGPQPDNQELPIRFVESD